MSRQSKERVLGFLLLLAIAAIFLPMLLDGDGARQGQLQAILPDRPQADEITHYQPQYQPHPDSSDVAPVRPTADTNKSQSMALRPPPAPISDIPASKQEPKSAPQVASKPIAKPSRTVSKTGAVKSKLGTDKPMLDQQGVPVGWTLQLASFKQRANAVALQEKLQKQGFKAYIRNKGELSKVFVGPDLQKSTMQNLKRELKRKFKLDGLILRFRP